MQKFDVIVIGAGAAGMMCAIYAGRRGRRVVLLDHGNKIGRKILISGGGRCNFTNINASPANFLSQNPHFCKSALSRYTPEDFISLVKKHRIAFHEKKLGQLFCDSSAQNIVDMLVNECRLSGVVFKLNCPVTKVCKNDMFLLDTNQGRYCSQSLIIATGGLSVPQTGASKFGYDIARQFGLKVIEPKPALDGFILSNKQLSELAGVSLDAVVTSNGISFRENILITHQGLSGPASLQASLYWNQGDPITINLLPDLDAYQWLYSKQQQGESMQLKNVLAEHLPKRFAEKFCQLYLHQQPLKNLSPKNLKSIAEQLHNWEIIPARTVGFKKAEVTKGGVDTNELDSRSMEAKMVPGLYFIGEVVDVTGWLGGYNFQWAWSSGFAAGEHA